MVQSSQHLRLALEPHEAIRINCKRLRQDLQRDGAAEFRVTRTVHLAHGTGTERRDYFVRTNAMTRAENRMSLRLADRWRRDHRRVATSCFVSEGPPIDEAHVRRI